MLGHTSGATETIVWLPTFVLNVSSVFICIQNDISRYMQGELYQLIFYGIKALDLFGTRKKTPEILCSLCMIPRYNWREEERVVNSFPQFTTTISGLSVHFIRARPTPRSGQVQGLGAPVGGGAPPAGPWVAGGSRGVSRY